MWKDNPSITSSFRRVKVSEGLNSVESKAFRGGRNDR